jgi:IS5 family transposase
MITVRYQQRTIYEPLALNVMSDYRELCWERWLLEVDGLLEDEELVKIVNTHFGEGPSAQSHAGAAGARRGRPNEVVLRLMGLKHLRGWSFEVVEREVRANVLYRELPVLVGRR